MQNEYVDYVDRLKKDHIFFVTELINDTEKVIDQYYKYYQIIPKIYIKKHIYNIKAFHINNPLAALYIESELGAPLRMLALVKQLNSCGYDFRNKDILDIGCSNGALLLACQTYSGKNLLGIDISNERIESGRALVGEKPIQLLTLDIVTEDLPLQYKNFDIIFSTDVTEHVRNVQNLFLQIKKYLSPDNNSFAFVTAFNKNNFINIKSEPHYRIPCMILLEYEKAKSLWYRLRDKLNSILDYEVYYWYSFQEYKTMANAAGLNLEIILTSFYNRESLLQNYQERIDKFNTEVRNSINELSLEDILKEDLYESLEKYCREYKEDHYLLSQNKYNESDLYNKYYQQPLNMILRHLE